MANRIKVRLPWQFLAEIEASTEDHYDITDADDATIEWADLCRLIVDDGIRATKRGDVDVMVTIEQVHLFIWKAEQQMTLCDPECGFDAPRGRARLLARFAERLAEEVAACAVDLEEIIGALSEEDDNV